MRQTGSAPDWQIAGPVTAGLLLLVLLLYRETSLFVTGLWGGRDGGTYTHGYLAMAISLYLVYRQRAVLATLTPCPSFIGLLVVAASGLLWLAALLMDVITIQIVALLLLIISIAWATLGGQVTRHLLFPLLVICFAIPIWDPLPPILQEITTDAVYWVIRVLGVPALREGHLIILPAGRLAIKESCSGMSYLLAALTLGMLYAHLNDQGFWSRICIVMVSGIAAILANMVRVFIVVYLAYKTDMQHPLVNDHFNLGWYLFGGLVFVLLLIDAKLNRHAGDPDTDIRQRDTMAAAQLCKRSTVQYLLVLVATVVPIAAGPAMAGWLEKQVEYPQDIVVKLPAGAGGWSGPSITQDSWSPVYHGAIAEKRAYRKGGQETYLYVGYYPVQSQGQELIYGLNRIGGQYDWYMQYPQGRIVKVGNETVLEQVLKSSDGQQRLVWYWYRVGGRQTISDYRAKLLQLWGILEGNLQATVFMIAADFDEHATAARQVLAEFLAANGKSLERVAVEP
jgi:exosortase A